MTWGVVTLVFFWMPLIAIPTGILSIVLARQALAAIRKSPDRIQGEDRAQNGRILGIIGLAISAMLLLLFALGFLLQGG
jgi:hypothetical protein